MESSYLRSQLDEIEITKPIFITGLARSGTTILLEQLVRTNLFATHQYRDFPFLHIPFWWNQYLNLATHEQAPIERPHKDRISITAESPEAFEEPLWQHYFTDIHAFDKLHALDDDSTNDRFERAFKDHLRKLILIRKRDRYLSKGNYNVTRLAYLGKVFPDAQFVIPIRHPVEHVKSLVKQHELFCQYASADVRIKDYLQFAGHYEFGPQRRAIRLNQADGDRTNEAWARGDQHLGYAIQWSQVYRFIDELRHQAGDLVGRMHVVRYEDFCNQPKQILATILGAAGLSAEKTNDLSFDDIAQSQRHTSQAVDVDAAIWKETGLVAQLFGYSEVEDEQKAKSKVDVTS